MALTSGDGPNRGTSAPSPRRLPKPADDGPRAETRSEGTRRPAQAPLPAAKAARNSRTPGKFTYPILGGLFGKDKAGNDLPDKKPIDLGLDKGKVTLTPEKQDYDTVMADVWGNLENEGASGVMKRKEGGSTLDPGQQRSQIVQNVADQYNVKARLGKRDAARIAREKRDRVDTEKQLTPAQWNKLSPLQQAAAQANADLAQAIARDFKDQGKHDSNKDGDDSQFQLHEKQVAELFGEDGRLGFKGLEYAPNTLAFLNERGIDKAALGGRTLDDLVSGDSLIDEATFKALNEKAGSDSRGKNIAFAQRLAKGQLQYQEDIAARLAKGDQLLSGTTSRTTNDTAAGRYGAVGTPTNMKLDKVRPETLANLDTYMQILARTDSDMGEALTTIKADLAERGTSTDETRQVWEAMIERSRQATTGEGKWFEGIDFPMRSPNEVAQALGAPTLKRRGKL